MPFTPDQERAIGLIAETYAKERIDKQVSDRLRWVQILAAAFGIAGIGGLVVAFLTLPDLATGKLLAQVTGLNTDMGKIIARAEGAKSAAEGAESAAKDANQAASSAKAATADLLRLDTKEIAAKAKAIQDAISQHGNADKVAKAALPFRSGSKPVKHGDTVVDIANPVQGALWVVRIDGDQYDFRYWLVVAHSGYADVEIPVVKIATLREFENAGAAKRAAFGPPKFKINGSQQLVVTNNWPDDSMTLSYSVFDPNQ